VRLARLSAATPATRVEALHAESIEALARARLGESLRAAEAMVALAATLDEPILQVRGLVQLARVHDALGEWRTAIADLRRAIAIGERAFGARHPHVLEAYENLGQLLAQLGEVDEGLANARIAVAIGEASFDERNERLGDAVASLGGTLVQVGRHDEALPIIDRGLAIQRVAEGEDAYNVAASYNNRGVALTALRRNTEAITAFTQAIAIWSRTVGEEHLDVAIALIGLAKAQDDVDALASATRARAIIEKVAPGNPLLADAIGLAGMAHAGRNEWPAALADLERALALRGAADVDPLHRAETQSYLAWAILASGGTGAARTRALALAREARDVYRSRGRADPPAIVLVLGDGP